MQIAIVSGVKGCSKAPKITLGYGEHRRDTVRLYRTCGIVSVVAVSLRDFT